MLVAVSSPVLEPCPCAAPVPDAVQEPRQGPPSSRTCLSRNSLQNFIHFNSCQGKLRATRVSYKYPEVVAGIARSAVYIPSWMWMSLWLYRVVNN